MVREVDSRNFNAIAAGEERRVELIGAAERASGGEVGNFTLEGFSGATGNPRRVRVAEAPVVVGSLVDDALRNVAASSEILGFAAGAQPEFTPDPQVYRTSGGARVVHLQQHHAGVPVFQMARTVRYDKERRLRDIVGDSVVIHQNSKLIPTVPVLEALKVALTHISEDNSDPVPDKWGQISEEVIEVPSVLSAKILTQEEDSKRFSVIAVDGIDPITAHLVLFYRGVDTRLGWQLRITMSNGVQQYAAIVSADNDEDEAPELLYLQSTNEAARAEGPVVRHNPDESQIEVRQFPLPLTDYPLSRATNTVPAGFPFDWVEENQTDGNYTLALYGNSSQTLTGNKNNDGQVVFEPANDEAGQLLNIFYFCNYMHDFFYMLGFDEAAGNFQRVNTGFGGAHGDPVVARAHPVAIQGTATMGTPIDGSAPRMNMGRVDSTGRHTAFDSDVVFHEFCHGVTNRLVGGRLNANALGQAQSRGMGEGWGDYFALSIHNARRDEEKTVTGDWVTGQAAGIRHHPYDESYPSGFGDLGTGIYSNSPHNIGEIWCATLMHMQRLLVGDLGRTLGNEIGWQVVVDGLKLSAANPSFIEMRDSIIEALDDLDLDESTNATALRAVWTAFAKFEMGVNAHSPTASVIGVLGDTTLPAGL